jgi:hypothetical protein
MERLEVERIALIQPFRYSARHASFERDDILDTRAFAQQ